MNIFKISKILSNDISDCIACITRPLLLMGSICGTSIITSNCPHSKNKTSVPNFKISKRLLILSLVSVIPLTMNVAYYFYIFANYNLIKSLFTKTVTPMLFCISGISTYASGVIQVRKKLIQLNGLAVLIENRHSYGFGSLLTPKSTKIFLKITYLFILIVILYVTYIMLHCLYIMIRFDNGWFRLRPLVIMCINDYAVTINLAQFVLFSALYKVLFKKMFLQVKILLRQRLRVATQKQFYASDRMVIPNELPLELNLKRLRKMYVALIYNHRQLNSFLNPNYLICCITTIGQLIVIFYYSITAGGSYIINGYLIAVKFCGMVVVLIGFLSFIEENNVTSEDILSFLFKYPISKLSTAEAAQVEMLITTLNIQKPVLRASDIFTVGTRLLASISGTVVTYVLVALQFHASWAKQ